MKRSVIIAIIILASLIIGAAGTSAQGQADQIYITWKALNFYPSHFEGKALPTFGTPIGLAVEVAQNGTLVDVSQSEVLWELDGKFLAGGRNVKQASFVTSKGVGGTHFVRVVVARGSNSFETSIRIPVVSPSVSIVAPLLGTPGTADGLSLNALPFFFNVSSLREVKFRWVAAGASPQESLGDNALLLTFGNTFLSSVDIAVTATNVRDPSERSDASITLNL